MLEKIRQYFKPGWRGFLTELLLFIVIFAGVRFWQQRDLPNGIAPPLYGQTLVGQLVDLRQLSRDKPVLLHFWTTWCPVCKLEQKSIQALSQKYTVITVATQSGDAVAVRQYLQSQGLSFPVLLDEEGELMQRYGLHGVPASFFINRRGEIAFREVGYTTQWGMQFRLWMLE